MPDRNNPYNSNRGNQYRRQSPSYKADRNYHQEELIGGKSNAQWANDIKKWVTDGINKETIIYAEAMGKKLKDDGLTTSQIRNVFGEMRKIQLNGFEEEMSSFLLLRPKLAYAAKRQNAKGMDAFYELFCTAYDAINTEDKKNSPKQFDQLLQVMEAVLAYHKYYGGQ
ncbi:MAG: type III-A CRISPR-associated protein Csm2 [Bacteroidetes bacterium]|nr:type III-A CRISPR-associated protein Csm2 [Bacteroidota bacterium]